MEIVETTTEQVKYELLQGRNLLTFVRIKLRIDGKPKDVLALVDSGCTSTMIDVGLIPERKIGTAERRMKDRKFGSFDNKDMVCRSVRVHGMFFSPDGLLIYYRAYATDLSTIRNITRRNTPTRRGNVMMVIGADLLTTYHCTLDYDRMEMTMDVLEKAEDKAEDNTEGEEGKG